MAANLYPVALDLRGRTCVVVGGGAVGARRAEGLAEAGANVLVVAPEITAPRLRELIDAGSVQSKEESFAPPHLTDAFLVVAATNQPAVNAAIADAARERGVLVNLAAPGDGEHGGDFATMATVRRGDLLIALTTGGAGPALSARLKRAMETQFGPEWEPYVALLREVRDAVKTRYATERERTEALRRLAADETILPRLAAGDADGAREEAWRLCLS